MSALGESGDPAQAKGGFAPAEPAMPLPRRVGRRVLLKLTARGGMGDVYLASTTGIEGAERPCIVKAVRRDHAQDASFLARFLDEARVQAQLHHPGVAQVLEAANDDEGEPYTVIEYVEGRSLSDVRQRAIQTGARIGWADATAIAIEVAQALAHVHERAGADGAPLGIVHRDLSPQNVMIGFAGEVKLIDFGTARGHNRRSHTVAGVVFAKPGYVAPEVARQQVGDGRIDLYALGIILWELCAGRRFLTSDPQRHLDDVAAGTVVVPPVAATAGAPAALDEVIARLTRNDPDERYARASLAVPGLARLLASAPTAAGAERGVRARVAALMGRLWPCEPARSRAEFARLLREAREVLRREDGDRSDRGEGNGRAAAAPDFSDRVDVAAQGDRREGERTPSGPGPRLQGTPYRLVRVIGKGASGVVWEAEHVELGRRVALKVLATEHAASPVALTRFRREARALASLSHPNLVETLDFGRALDGRVFLAMELLEGETLEEHLRAQALGALGAGEATRIAVEACDALAAAHAAGLVHRDLKPENLMLTRDGAVKLLDFGIAMSVPDHGRDGGGGRSRTTDEGPCDGRGGRGGQAFAIFGTPEYMAPEQVSGEPVDARTDVYALGCVLYQMLTGSAPFEGPSSVVVMGRQVRDPPRPPRARAPECGIPAALEEVVMRALEKDPARRFASAKAMRAALVATARLPERRRTTARRVALGVMLAAGMLASAGASASWTRTHWASFDPPPPAARTTQQGAPSAGSAQALPSLTATSLAGFVGGPMEMRPEGGRAGAKLHARSGQPGEPGEPEQRRLSASVASVTGAAVRSKR
ncbi:MAG: serine/threonine protein kinase [Myxococcales bacterium]|nr:serine/threonine protein kinase [Myxococcales bacterium]